jgi:shikimate dehydrogenase
MITGHTELLPIVADPIEHVRTPEIFNAHLARIGVDAVVVPVHVRPDDLRTVVSGLRATRNLRSIIVTVPHKIAIVDLCDELHPSARLMGAVNIVRREPDGRLLGANFDGAGLAAAVAAEVGSLSGRRVYLAGAGGVARAIAFAMAQAGAASVAIHNRSADKADALLAAVRTAFPAVATARGDERPADADVAINATSLGLKPGDAMPFAVDALPPTATVAEVVMNPPITPLLERAQARGLRIVKGDAMLHRQLEAWVEFLGLKARGGANG